MSLSIYIHIDIYIYIYTHTFYSFHSLEKANITAPRKQTQGTDYMSQILKEFSPGSCVHCLSFPLLKNLNRKYSSLQVARALHAELSLLFIKLALLPPVKRQRFWKSSIFFFFSFLSAWHSMWEVLVPRPGIEPLSLQWKFGVPVPGPPAVGTMWSRAPLLSWEAALPRTCTCC